MKNQEDKIKNEEEIKKIKKILKNSHSFTVICETHDSIVNKLCNHCRDFSCKDCVKEH